MSEVSMVSQAEIGKIQPEVEQKPVATGSELIKSADSTFLSRLKKLVPEKTRHTLRMTTQKGALTAAGLSTLISSGCGNTKQERTLLPIPTPAVSEQPTGMPSANIEFTRTPPPKVEEQATPMPTQEAPSEPLQPSEKQEIKELVSYSPSITVVDAAPSVPTEGIIQKEFVSNDEMLKNILGDEYISKEQIIEEFGENYEEKWNEVVDKYPQALVYRFADTYFNHSKDVVNVVDNTLERRGLDSTGINMLPLQKIFDKESIKFIKDSSGNPGVSLNFDPKRIIKLLEGDQSRVINGSFQVGNVELFQKTDIETDVIPKYEEGKFKGIWHPTEEDKFYIGAVGMEARPEGFVFTDENGKKVEPVTMEELKRMKLAESEVIERKSTSHSIVGAYTKEKAMENLPKLFELCNAYPDKFFVFAEGNSGEDIRGTMEKLKDQIPNNLLITAEWLKGSYSGFDYEGPFMVYGRYGKVLGPDIYVNNEELGQPHGSSFSAPIIAAEVDRLLKRGLSFEQVKEKILASSDTHVLGLNDGTKPTVKVFNPTNHEFRTSLSFRAPRFTLGVNSVEESPTSEADVRDPSMRPSDLVGMTTAKLVLILSNQLV